MTFTTPNGIRYPDDPNAYADIIQFFREMAEDVDTKFLSRTAGSASMAGWLSSLAYVSSNGGRSQASLVFQSAPAAGSAFNIYDDSVRIDNVTGRRFWIAGANGSDVAIRTRSDAENLNRISLRAATLDLNGAVTINGTLNVTGTKTQYTRYDATVVLAASKTSWTPMPSPSNVGFTFVTPPSGVVTIGFGGSLPTYSNTVQLTYRIKEGAAIGSGTLIVDVNPVGWDPNVEPPPHSISIHGSTAVKQHSSVYSVFQYGAGTNSTQLVALKPNTTYNVEVLYRNQNAVTLNLLRFYFVITPDF